ncbi:hypothetical protein [Sphingopyxis sp. 22461]
MPLIVWPNCAEDAYEIVAGEAIAQSVEVSASEAAFRASPMNSA